MRNEHGRPRLTLAHPAGPDALPPAAPSDLEEVDEKGDVIFRFKLTPDPSLANATLAEIYRRSIHDLLKLVRFYWKGGPVLVDAFAFLSDPDTRIPILPEAGRGPATAE